MERCSGRALVCAAVVLFALAPFAATAHVTKDVAGGKFAVTVGFLNEPAYVGQPNGLDLKVTRYGGNPPEDIDQTLKAEVSVGGAAPMPLTLTALGGGRWAGNFIPTAPGDYTFHVAGTIDGNAVDESFTSSSNTFSSVEAATALQYPVKVPAADELEQQVASARDEAALARTFGIAGVAAGVVGLALAAAALARARRPTVERPIPPAAGAEPAPSGRLIK